MSEIIDLTGEIKNEMWRYPPPFIAPEIMRIEGEIRWKKPWKYYGEEIHISTLTGTYLETAAHLFPEELTVDEIPVGELIREALIVKIPKTRKEPITLDEMKGALAEKKEDVKERESVLIATGWDRHWNEEMFVEQSPYLQSQLVDWLLERDISLLGGDIPCFDNVRDPQEVLPRIFSKGIVIVAPLVNLIYIPVTRVKLYVFPLKLKGACASPCRVICEF